VILQRKKTKKIKDLTRCFCVVNGRLVGKEFLLGKKGVAAKIRRFVLYVLLAYENRLKVGSKQRIKSPASGLKS